MSLQMKFEENLCDPNPCKNDGSCKVDGEDEVCTCTPEYEGLRCEDKSKYLEPWMDSLFEKYFWNKWHLLI